MEEVDHELINVYLRKVCKTVVETLKRQRGNQYGFGDDVNGSNFIAKNMTEEMLDHPDATHTKPIENLFGNHDRVLKKTGPQGFGKASDNLIIKYSGDLIDSAYKWRTKANR